MGNQGHSHDSARMVNEYIWAGAIGDVREVHVWTNRPLSHWPQGIPRPEPMKSSASELRWNIQGVMTRLANAMTGTYPAPDTLAWDLFLGPAPQIEYHPALSSLQLARLGGLGRGRPRRHGGAPH